MYNQIWSPLKQEFVATLSLDGRQALKMYVNSFMTGGAFTDPPGDIATDPKYKYRGLAAQKRAEFETLLNDIKNDREGGIIILANNDKRITQVQKIVDQFKEMSLAEALAVNCVNSTGSTVTNKEAT